LLSVKESDVKDKDIVIQNNIIIEEKEEIVKNKIIPINKARRIEIDNQEY
jgi:hypothetical protein